MTVRYHQRHGTLIPDYQCLDENIQRTAPACQRIPGHGIDQAISQLLLETVTPLALEVALTVQAELETRADETDQLRRCTCANAPASTPSWPAAATSLSILTTDWSPTPSKPTGTTPSAPSRHAQDEYEHARPPPPTPRSTSSARPRSASSPPTSPALWTDPATPARERKRIVRLLLDDVTINKTDQIHVHVRFRGGQTTTVTPPAATQTHGKQR